jgi:N-acetyl-gamma-glutamyl-phosphate reductase
MVAARLLAGHPHFELAFCTSDKWAGDSVRERLGAPVPRELRFVANAEGPKEARSVDAVLLATSAEVSLKLAGDLLAEEKIVLDLSGAFRLDQVSDYPRWYRFEHDEAELLSIAHYGLPELFGRPRGALIANPGCYPTAAILPLAPLLMSGLIEREGIVIDAKSGVTGAGRQANEAYSFVEVDDDFRAYKLLTHQHTPEIAQILSRVAKERVKLTFTAHLLPIRRGILSTGYARPCPGVTKARLVECLQEAYAETPFVQVVAPEQVTLGSVVGTNFCRLGVESDDDVVIVVSAIDNLVKGAAGQAMQNLNLTFEFPETAGLDTLQRSTP